MVLGPLVIPLPRLFLMLGVAAAMLAAYVAERRKGTSVEKPLWLSFVIGLLVARLSYVLGHLAAFKAQPWQALYLWQGGYSPLLGVLAALMVAMLACLPRSGYSRRRLFVPLMVGLAVWGGLSWGHYALEQGTARPLPALTVERLGGAPVSLASFQGEPVVLNLWASWCPPCRREMPVLAAAQQARTDVHFLFVNQGEGRETVRGYLAAEGLELHNVLLDLGGDVASHFGARGLPTTLFFDADGQLADTHLGALTRATLGDYITELTHQEEQ